MPDIFPYRNNAGDITGVVTAQFKDNEALREYLGFSTIDEMIAAQKIENHVTEVGTEGVNELKNVFRNNDKDGGAGVLAT